MSHAELSDLGEKNTRCSVKFEFQINYKPFNVSMFSAILTKKHLCLTLQSNGASYNLSGNPTSVAMAK